MFLYQVIHHLSHSICPIPFHINWIFQGLWNFKKLFWVVCCVNSSPIRHLNAAHHTPRWHFEPTNVDLLLKIATKKCLTSFIEDLENIGTCIQHATYTQDPLDQMSFSIKNVTLMKIGQAYLGMQWATIKYIGNILWGFECPKSWLSINPIPLTHAN
jgi:hypothetical protein